MTVSREEVKEILAKYRAGEITPTDLGQWAYDALAVDNEFGDPLLDEAMYNLVSLHNVGWVFQKHRPDENKINEIYKRL